MPWVGRQDGRLPTEWLDRTTIVGLAALVNGTLVIAMDFTAPSAAMRARQPVSMARLPLAPKPVLD